MGRGNQSLFAGSRSPRWQPRLKLTLKLFFLGTNGPMAMGLGMQHWGHRPIIVYSLDDPGLTLIYFMARSNLAPYAFVWGKSENYVFFRIYHRPCYKTCTSEPQ